MAEELRKQIDELLFEWDQLTNDPNGLVYSYRGQNKKETDESKKRAVLMRPMELETAMGQWKVAGSLREVEEEVSVVLKEYDGGDV